MTNDQAGLPGELFTTIDHVGIAVPDLDEAIAFYAQAFGVQSVHEETNEEQGVREAMLAVGDGDDPHPAARPADARSRRSRSSSAAPAPGLQQLAFRVEDVEAVSATLRERGLRLLYDAPKRGTADSRVNFVHPKDAGGVLVELVQPAAGATDPDSPSRLPTGNIRRTAPHRLRADRRPGSTRERDQGRHPRRPAGRRGRPDGAGVLPRGAGAQGRAGHVRGPRRQGEGPAQVAARRGGRHPRARPG